MKLVEKLKLLKAANEEDREVSEHEERNFSEENGENEDPWTLDARVFESTIGMMDVGHS